MVIDSPAAFYLALEDDPRDPVTLQALADWFDEQGDTDAAACLRWLVRHRLGPFRFRKDGGLSTTSANWHDGWLWWAVDDPSYGRDWGHPASCLLPRELWRRLPHSFAYSPAVFKEYHTCEGAFEALFDAWSRVRPIDGEPAGRARS